MNGSLPPPSAFEADADEYGAYEQEQQVQMMQEQDEALDGVFKTVGNLRQQADDMGRELEEQDEMLGDVDRLADRVQGKLANGMKRVGWVIKHNEGMIWQRMMWVFFGWQADIDSDTWSSCCIGVLIFVLILLLVLVLIL